MSDLPMSDRMAGLRSSDAIRGVTRAWWLFLILGVLWILFGMFVLSYNVGSLLALAIFAGVTFIMHRHQPDPGLRPGRGAGDGSTWSGGALDHRRDHRLRLAGPDAVGHLGRAGLVPGLQGHRRHRRRLHQPRPSLLVGGAHPGDPELLLGMWAAGYPGRALVVFVNLVGIYAIFYGFTELVRRLRPARVGRQLDRERPAV
jgi:hypothetical protein